MIHKFQLLLSVTATLIYDFVKWHSVIRRKKEKANNKEILHLTCRLHLAVSDYFVKVFSALILCVSSLFMQLISINLVCLSGWC